MPEVTKDMINGAWTMADVNGDKKVDGEEYMRINKIANGPPGKDEENLNWYWNHFAQDPK